MVGRLVYFDSRVMTGTAIDALAQVVPCRSVTMPREIFPKFINLEIYNSFDRDF